MKKYIILGVLLCFSLVLVGCSPLKTVSPSDALAQGAQEQLKPYLDVTGKSQQTLMEELQADGMDAETASRTVANAELDFNEQAVRKAKSHLQSLPYSLQGLQSKLEAENFTPEQAKYGAENCGANWNEQAVKKAKEYLKIKTFPKEQLLSQLQYDGFTQEQAQYAVTQTAK